MDDQTFHLTDEDKGEDSCTVKEWIQSIQDGDSPDKLSELDQSFNGQLGALGDALEHMHGTKTGVPLFEFRRLKGVKTTGMKDFVNKAEEAVIELHKKYK